MSTSGPKTTDKLESTFIKMTYDYRLLNSLKEKFKAGKKTKQEVDSFKKAQSEYNFLKGSLSEQQFQLFIKFNKTFNKDINVARELIDREEAIEKNLSETNKTLTYLEGSIKNLSCRQSSNTKLAEKNYHTEIAGITASRPNKK